MNHEDALAWADGHVKAVEAELHAYWRKNPTILGRKFDGETGEFVHRLLPRRLPDNPDWVLLVGDALHNMRVALDYLAFHIVNKYPDAPAADQISFPIRKQSTNYPSLASRCLGNGVPAEFKRRIENLQPKYRRDAEDTEPLFLLDELERIHKHRRLLSGQPRISFVELDGPGRNIEIVEVSPREGRFDEPTELYRYRVVDAAKAIKEPKLTVRQYVCFDEIGPAHGMPVVSTLQLISDHIRYVIFIELKDFV